MKETTPKRNPLIYKGKGKHFGCMVDGFIVKRIDDGIVLIGCQQVL